MEEVEEAEVVPSPPPPPPKKWSFPSSINLGSCIGGVPIKLHLTFFLLLLLELIGSFRYAGQFPLYILFVFVLYGPVLLITVLMHEFGHVWMTKRQGGEVGGIVLWPLGGFALCGPTDSLGGDFKVAIAGPMTHIPQTLFWWMIYLFVKYEFTMDGSKATGLWPAYSIYLTTMKTGANGFFQVLSGQAVWLNVILFCFNLLLPAYPLDGGRTFAAGLMLMLKMEPMKAALFTAWTAMVISSAMVAYAVVSLFVNGFEFSLYFGMVGIWVFFQSYELRLNVKKGDLKNDPIFGRECYGGAPKSNVSGCGIGGDLSMAEEGVMT